MEGAVCHCQQFCQTLANGQLCQRVGTCGTWCKIGGDRYEISVPRVQGPYPAAFRSLCRQCLNLARPMLRVALIRLIALNELQLS